MLGSSLLETAPCINRALRMFVMGLLFLFKKCIEMSERCTKVYESVLKSVKRYSGVCVSLSLSILIDNSGRCYAGAVHIRIIDLGNQRAALHDGVYNLKPSNYSTIRTVDCQWSGCAQHATVYHPPVGSMCYP